MHGTVAQKIQGQFTIELSSGESFRVEEAELPREARVAGSHVQLSFYPIGDSVSQCDARDLLNHILGAA